MKNQCHLVVSEDSLPEKVSHQGLCGQIVENSAYACIWDEQAMDSRVKINVLEFSNVCPKCIAKYADSRDGGRAKLYAFFNQRAVRKEQDNDL